MPTKIRKAPATRVPPHSHETEQAVLGALLFDGEVGSATVATVLEMIPRGDYFFTQSHRTIYETIRILAECRIGIDIVTVADELEKTEELESIGGRTYLAEIAGNVATGTHAKHYCQILIDKYQYRKIIDSQSDIISQAFNQAERPEKIINGAIFKLFKTADQSRAKGWKLLSDIAADVMTKFDDIEHGKTVIGIPTGFNEMDKKLAGLGNGDFVVVSARPSVGKTAFMNCMASNMASKNTRVGFITLETVEEEFAARSLCTTGGVDSMRMKTGHPQDDDWKKLTEAGSKVNKWPYLISRGSRNIVDIIISANAQHASGNLDILFIDYLQKITVPREWRLPRFERFSLISNMLKNLALDLNIPIVVSSQLGRQVEMRRNKRPMLSDLKESGDIEQDADVVIGLYRPIMYASKKELEEKRYGGTSEVIIMKNRNGPTGTIDFIFDEKFTRFTECSSYNKEDMF